MSYINVEFPLDVSLYCKCGKNLCVVSKVEVSEQFSIRITLEPCSVCSQEKYDEGYNKGYEDGSNKAFLL